MHQGKFRGRSRVCLCAVFRCFSTFLFLIHAYMYATWYVVGEGLMSANKRDQSKMEAVRKIVSFQQHRLRELLKCDTFLTYL